MACCTSRCFLLTLCVVQLIATIERQIFDFLGYMWSPIVVNFVQIIVVILGFFGAYQYRPKYIAVYIVWTLLWLAWNIFVICFYLETGVLNKESSILNMGTGSKSWWETHGIGCKSSFNFSGIPEEQHYFPLPTTVEGCILQYYYVECIQAGIQCFLALCGFGSACYTFYAYTREDDTSTARVNSRNLPYSIEYRSQTLHDANGTLYQRPMTPRKVKQRSTRSKRGSSRQRYYQNPVTKLMDSKLDTSSHDSYSTADLYRGQTNPLYCSSKPDLQPGIRPNSVLYFNGRPSPIYMNDSDTVI